MNFDERHQINKIRMIAFPCARHLYGYHVKVFFKNVIAEF